MEARLSFLENYYHDLHARLSKSEDASAYLQHRVVVLSEGLVRCHQVKPAQDAAENGNAHYNC